MSMEKIPPWALKALVGLSLSVTALHGVVAFMAHDDMERADAQAELYEFTGQEALASQLRMEAKENEDVRNGALWVGGLSLISSGCFVVSAIGHASYLREQEELK